MKPIQIVGGGLAGLTLGIGLRRHNVPVTLFEAGHYPRHRVCGELISGRGQTTLQAMDLMPLLGDARRAETVAFYTPQAAVPPRPLATPAICLSRYALDHRLAREFSQIGGDLQVGRRWSGDFSSPGVVRASGRRLRPPGNGWRWLGLKAHARGAVLNADLEMHVLPHAYVGICRLNDGLVNVCGLFRAAGPQPGLAAHWRDWLGGPERSSLRERLKSAEFIEDTFCSVAGFTLRPERAQDTDECRVGDALTMIPPITGNGMSMAFESAYWAVTPLAQYSRGDLNWDEARAGVARSCDRVFCTRLWHARWLQTALLQPTARAVLVFCINRFAPLQQWLFRRTR